MRRSPLIALFLLSGAACLHAWHLSTVLPDRVASHFDAAGRADGWTSREGFVLVYFALIGVVTASFGGLAPLVARLPDSLINLPNKAYWLAPERRASTLAWLTGWSSMFGAATLLLTMALMRQVERVNLGSAERISGLPLVASYVALSLSLIVALLVKLGRKPA